MYLFCLGLADGLRGVAGFTYAQFQQIHNRDLLYNSETMRQ